MRRLIAEIGSCNGDLSLAIDTAEAAIEAGAWQVKGQMFHADRLVTKTAAGYGHQSIVEKPTQHEAFSNALTYDQWHTVSTVCQGKFFASVFDLEACQNYPYEYIKIASGDITYKGLVVAASQTGKRMIVSTGAATMSEIYRMRSWIPGVPVTLLVCTLSYPTEACDANVNRVTKMKSLKVDVGYSDHTRGTAAAHLAFDLGASMVEKHFTIRPGTGGDHDFAIGPDQVREIVERVDAASDAVTLIYGGSDIVGPRVSELPALNGARRSLHASVDIPSGTKLRSSMVSVLRPAVGIEPWLLQDTLGRHTTRRIVAGDPITTDCFYHSE